MVLLLVGVIVALQVPAVQNFVTQKAIAFVSGKTHSEVRLGEINIAFPKSLVLKDLFLEDLNHDTLFYVHRLSVDIDMLKLLSNKIELNKIDIEKLTAHITRSMPDSSFNFDFIINAFSPADSVTTVPTDTSQKSAWKFAIGAIELKELFLTFADETAGSNMNFKIGDFRTRFKEFDLDAKKFHIKNISLSKSDFSIVQTQVSPDTDTSSSAIEYDVDVNELDLTTINLLFQTPAQKISVQIGKAGLTADKIDLPKQQLDLKKFSLTDSKIEFAINKVITADTIAQKTKEAVTQAPSKQQTKPWNVSLNTLALKGNVVVFNNFNADTVRGIDFNHLKLSGIEADIHDIHYNEKEILATIREFKLADKSGFEIRHFEAKVTYDSVHAELANLDLETSESRLRKHISISYPSIQHIADSIGNLRIDADLDHIVVGLGDVLLFQPDLAEQINSAGLLAERVELNAKIKGAVKDLHIPLFELSASKNTFLTFRGSVKGLPDAANSHFDILLSKFSTTKADVRSLIKPGVLPDNIEIPDKLSVSGFFKGYLKNFNGKADVKTSFGNAIAEVAMSTAETYDAAIDVDHFDLGQLLRQPEMMGSVTLKAKIIGSGLSLETAKGKINLAIEQAVFRNYNYQHITANGNFTGSSFEGNATANDPNLALNFDGLLNFDKQAPYYKFTLDLQGMDLQALHFMEDDLRVKGLLNADIKGSNLNDLNGNIDLRKVAITRHDTIHTIDSLLFVSLSDSGSKSIDINSPFVSGSFKGNIGIADMGAALQEHLSHYIHLSDSNIKPYEEQNFSFNLQLHNSDIYTVLVPGLKKFVPGDISGNFNSGTHALDLKMTIPEIQYNSIHIDSFQLNIASDSQSLRYHVALKALDNGEYFVLNPAVSGKVQNDSAGIHLTIQDEENKLKYLLAGNIEKQDQNYRFHFIPDSVILNYQPWSVTPDNFLVIGKEILFANNIALSNGGQFFKLNSTGNESSNAPLEITFNDFNLEALTEMIEANEIVAGGLINGSVLVKNLQSTPAFNADLTIDHFSFKEDTLGTITAKANNETANNYTVAVTIKGEGNDIAVDGFYNTAQKENALNFDVALNNVNLATLEAYTFGQATRLKGSLKGNLKIRGSAASPDLNGSMTFNDAGFNVTYINSYYTLKNEEILFQNTKATFPNFRLTDTLGNAAVITGWVAPDPKETVVFDLTIESNDFLAINSSRNDTGQFKGRAILDSHIKITGTKDFPKVNANIKLDDGSALSITRPKEKATNEESRGVVIFINRNDTLHPIMTRIKNDSAAGPVSSMKGVDISANIEVNKNSSLAIVIDPASGDSLQVFGDATLNFTLDPSGKTSLTGRYEISEGSYRLSFYDFVKKKFILKEGSITWNGDPMEAEVDLTALYEVRTSPIDLVADQLTGLSDQDKNMYQQLLPFQLYMYMKGELLKPEITFSLDLPPNERGALNGSVYAKLNQLNENESDLNKQVFALLILNRFIADDPLESSKDNDVANVARNSVSKLLSQQLNRLAGNYVKGVQLNINLQSYEDYTSGEAEGRTELELGVSKQFFNNRLNVQVGGNIDLEGEKVKENNISNITGDLSGEYKLTPEGTYQLHFYRRNDYDMLQGEIIESALGFVFTKDYDRERELFKRTEEEKLKKKKSDSKSDGIKPPPGE